MTILNSIIGGLFVAATVALISTLVGVSIAMPGLIAGFLLGSVLTYGILSSR